MKFSKFKLGTVYAYTNPGHCVRYEKILINPENDKMIYCSYSLANSKATTSDGVDCRVLDIPMKVMEDNSVEVSHHTLIHKLNSGHYKSIKYEDLILGLGHLNFAISL